MADVTLEEIEAQVAAAPCDLELRKRFGQALLAAGRRGRAWLALAAADELDLDLWSLRSELQSAFEEELKGFCRAVAGRPIPGLDREPAVLILGTEDFEAVATRAEDIWRNGYSGSEVWRPGWRGSEILASDFDEPYVLLAGPPGRLALRGLRVGLAEIERIARIETLLGLELSDAALEAEALPGFAALRELRELHLDLSGFDGAGCAAVIAALKPLPSLRTLELRGASELAVADLEGLSASGLRRLELRGAARLAGPLDEALGSLVLQLEWLDLRETGAWLTRPERLKETDDGLWCLPGEVPDILDESAKNPIPEYDWTGPNLPWKHRQLLESGQAESYEVRQLAARFFAQQASTLEALAALPEAELRVARASRREGWVWSSPAELLRLREPAIGFALKGSPDLETTRRALTLAARIETLIHLEVDDIEVPVESLRAVLAGACLASLNARMVVVGDEESLPAPELEFLNLSPGGAEWSDLSFWERLEAPKLTHIELSYVALTGAFLGSLVERCPDLKVITVTSCEEGATVAPEGLKRLSELRLLTELDLGLVGVPVAALEAMHGLEIHTLSVAKPDEEDEAWSAAYAALIASLPYVYESP